MRNSSTWFIIAAIMLTLDFYVFQAIKTVSHNASDRTKIASYLIYWLLAVATIATLMLFPYVQSLQTSKFFRNYIFSIMAGLFIAKLVGSTFFFIDDLRRIVMWIVGKFINVKNGTTVSDDSGISRGVFLSWLGLGTGTALFGTLLYGFSNKYSYQIKKVQIAFDNLPKAFKGLKVVHISDIHCGSFQDKNAVHDGMDLIMQQNADLILFTGDLVNDRHTEVHEYMDVFNKLKAPLGVYSTLGNHDYGDYVTWESEHAKKENLAKLKNIHAELGWRLLMNEHVVLTREDDSIALLGIENWGAKGRFPKYGKMHEAHPGTEKYPFKILLSHDPSHWDAEVKIKYPDIDLMLSGHTHGMQFGIENPYFKWSPVQWMYKQWAGLYENGKQKLYVNRGFGFIGYPGRVGILPEITVIELT
jgi:predicted MPP superfamily phosphohydrolase